MGKYFDQQLPSDWRRAVSRALRECQEQDLKWGGPEHDDKHSSHDWIAYIVKHAGKAVMWPWDLDTFERQMVRVTALGIQALRWCERIRKRLDDLPEPPPTTGDKNA